MDKDPKQRLGFTSKNEIKQHPFFKDIDFQKVLDKKYTPYKAIID